MAIEKAFFIDCRTLYMYIFQSMYKNELAIVSIKPSLAYGSQGRKPDIPPDSRITYLFGLLHFEKQKDISEMTWAQVRNLKMQVVMTICFVNNEFT